MGYPDMRSTRSVCTTPLVVSRRSRGANLGILIGFKRPGNDVLQLVSLVQVRSSHESSGTVPQVYLCGRLGKAWLTMEAGAGARAGVG